ncbi:hypothetical protein F5J12DRAFT_785519 [Pisolithus orientalis]|uniref:uncharacterized protein n=1 Tax=Pisolithus orientalis TaxID=936130 RepID=UPI0022248CBD|nr:uncharacterized protein F5J12DRAFT_785519 [Pisolithus orientalis]KAI5996036.1 hypothetical protein F5J12DRAFT_785519 [Pisolithus orientalis]
MHSTCDTSLPFPLSCNAISSLGVGHPPQCKLTPDSHITQTHPSNQEDPGFLGRGTVCYLACYNGEYYVIKDCWVEELEQRTALHEVNMMKLVQDINGVPKLQHYWVVKSNSRLSRGVSSIQDCSINNTMIEDFANGSHGFLLDWEFAVWVTLQGNMTLGGTCQDISHEKTLLGLWSEKVAEDLKIARCTKFTFLNDPSESRLDSEVSQYFQDPIPLANECMPYEKPPEMMNAFQQIIAQHKVLNSSMRLSQENNMDVIGKEHG